MAELRKKSTLKSIVFRQYGLTYKDYFNIWKKKADKLETVEFCNQYGPLRQDINHLNREIGNLKNFLKDDGYTDKEL